MVDVLLDLFKGFVEEFCKIDMEFMLEVGFLFVEIEGLLGDVFDLREVDVFVVKLGLDVSGL